MPKLNHTLSVSLRPKSFSEVIGQKTVVQAIQKQLSSDRLPVAWMFVGPPGLGKTTLALILARELGGVENPEIENRNAADLNGVDDARQLVALAGYSPLIGKKRTVILDEAQQLTAPAQNVLLKAFEQEDSPTVWVICTTDPHKIIKPLRDRCLTYNLASLNPVEVDELICRAFSAVHIHPVSKIFCDAVRDASLRSPRVILQAVERFAGGMSAEESVTIDDPARPDFKQIATEVLKGDWSAVATLLKPVPNSDSLALRGFVSAYLSYALLRATSSSEADMYYRCLAEAAKFTQGFQDGTTAPFTRAWLYAVCRIIRKEKK
jgi:Holliday junction resolvasome RuvABC ATP-dependent DNA helicase subunit